MFRFHSLKIVEGTIGRCIGDDMDSCGYTGIWQDDGFILLVGELDVGDGDVTLASTCLKLEEVVSVAECSAVGGPHDHFVLVALIVAVSFDVLESRLVGWVAIERHVLEGGTEGQGDASVVVDVARYDIRHSVSECRRYVVKPGLNMLADAVREQGGFNLNHPPLYWKFSPVVSTPKSKPTGA